MTTTDDATFFRMIAEASAEAALPYFRHDPNIENKADGGFDPVTEGDKAVERALRARWQPAEAYPMPMPPKPTERAPVPHAASGDQFPQHRDLVPRRSGDGDLRPAALGHGARAENERLTRAFAGRARSFSEPRSASLARRAARLFAEEGARVNSVAARLGVTARHLRRAFADNIGVGPKRFARAARLQRAVRLARASSDWGRIAADTGYYDQAHLIADFGALVGLTPSAFAKRAREASAPEWAAWPLG